MKHIRRTCLGAFVVAVLAVAPAMARAAVPPKPAWSVYSMAVPSNFVPGGSGEREAYEVVAVNAGGEHTDRGPVVLTDALPAGLAVDESGIELLISQPEARVPVDFAEACDVDTSGPASVVTCVIEESTPGTVPPTEVLPVQLEPVFRWPGESLRLIIPVTASPCSGGSAACPIVNRVEVRGGGAPEPAAIESESEVGVQPATSGFQFYRPALTAADGSRISQAGGRVFQYTTAFAINLERTPPGSNFEYRPAGGDIKDIAVSLPPGLVGNPTAIGHCSAQQFNTITSINEGTTTSSMVRNDCPDSSAIGYIVVMQLEGLGSTAAFPVYNLVPPPGMPAQFGFIVYPGVPVYIDTSVRTGGDYGIDASIPQTTQAKRITAASLTLWGTPADPVHDRVRGTCLGQSGRSLGNCEPSGFSPEAFFRLPTSCTSPLAIGFSFNTWLRPDSWASEASHDPAPTGCSAPPFAPSIESKATTGAADSPSGLHFDLHNPQPQDPEAPGEADLRDATVTLPEGFVVNPSSADGLGACSEAQVGYTGTSEGRASFTGTPAECPDAAKIGTVTVKTPLVDHPLPGAVYLARQGENPFGSLLAIYITVNDPQTGVVVKVPGKVSPDPATGRLTTTVQQSPQLPFEDFELNFFEGARAPLRTPATCGTHTTTTTLVPWSAPEGPTAHPQGAFQTTAPAAGQGVCPPSDAAIPASWAFSAGARAPLAGAYSPFTVHLARPDGSRELSSLEVALPAGVAARFAGVAECSDAQIAAVVAREVPGGGKAEERSPSCPAASRIGTATVGSGAGPHPYYVSGAAYLAGPYKGAPFSIVVITPAVAGPFDLGAVVVRSALEVDPFTAQGTVRSDPIPRVLDGIPLDVRSLTVTVDRPGFTLNPTSCEAKSVAGTAVSVGGTRTALANRFQVGECGALKFKPKVKIRLKGATKRAGHPALRAVVTMPAGGANIARAQVGLPHAEFLDQGNLDNVCTRPRLRAGTCPASSVYGHAKAWTPLLEKPLEGPVYLGVGFGYKLPALVADLNGQVRILLVGKVDTTKRKGIRNTFEAVPDAPVSRFVLTMKGGKKYGLLENSEDICRKKQRASALFDAQNGPRLHMRPVISNSCGKKRHKKRARSGHRRGNKAKAHHKRGNRAS